MRTAEQIASAVKKEYPLAGLDGRGYARYQKALAEAAREAQAGVLAERATKQITGGTGNAVEKLQAAIEKLTAERDAGTPGPWAYGGNGCIETTGETILRAELEYADAELVVTLRRTINVELDLLRLAIEYGALDEGRGSRFSRAAIALADAILGTVPEASREDLS